MFLVGDNVLNGCGRVSLNLLKGNKLIKSQTATTVESLQVDDYAVDIKRVETHLLKIMMKIMVLSFTTVSHAKMIHNAKEKKL